MATGCTTIEEETPSHLPPTCLNSVNSTTVTKKPVLVYNIVAKEMTGRVAMVTGASGFLGQHIVKLLHEKAPHIKEIRVFDMKPFQQKLGKLF